MACLCVPVCTSLLNAIHSPLTRTGQISSPTTEVLVAVSRARLHLGGMGRQGRGRPSAIPQKWGILPGAMT